MHKSKIDDSSVFLCISLTLRSFVVSCLCPTHSTPSAETAALTGSSRQTHGNCGISHKSFHSPLNPQVLPPWKTVSSIPEMTGNNSKSRKLMKHPVLRTFKHDSYISSGEALTSHGEVTTQLTLADRSDMLLEEAKGRCHHHMFGSICSLGNNICSQLCAKQKIAITTSNKLHMIFRRSYIHLNGSLVLIELRQDNRKVKSKS